MEQLEAAKSHEDIWNAAQRQMVATGKHANVCTHTHTNAYLGVWWAWVCACMCMSMGV
jgi:hypothetical protein